MCNKCNAQAVPATPATPLLAKWAETGNDYDSDSRKIVMRRYIASNHHTEPYSHSRARRGWVELHQAQQKNGRSYAKQKATANKEAKAIREPMTIEDMQATHAYLKALSYDSTRADKIEPALYTTMRNFDNGVWFALDIMNTLHPYINDSGISSHNDYQKSQTLFVRMNMLHRVHISTEDVNQIAYYPTLKHMREGREVRTRLGRYLTKYQNALQLTDLDIKNMAEKHMSVMRARGGWTVDFIEHDDVDGWLRVYGSDDVNSCMKGESAVRVYAHEKSVLRLAHVKSGDKIIARCIVREDDKKGWLRVYPDENGSPEGRFLLDYLKTNGYENRINLDGVLLQCIEAYSGYVCPYLDYGSGGDQTVDVVTRDGKRYLMAGGGEYNATNTDGTTETNDCECDECGYRTHEDNLTYIEYNGRSVCEDCRDNGYTYAYGERWQTYYPEDECVQVNDEWYLIETISNHDIYQCERDGDWYHIDDMTTTIDGTYHQDYVVSVDREDSDGNDFVYMDKVHTLSDGTTCHEDNADEYQAVIDEQAQLELALEQ